MGSALLALVAGCSPPATVQMLVGEPIPAATEAAVDVPAAEVIVLPAARLEGDVSLEETLARRRSVRSYQGDPLTLGELGQLFWAAQGVTHEVGYRTAPSAGALYPLEIYAATDRGLYHYLSEGHRAAVVHREGWRAALCGAALVQESVCRAPAVFVVSAVYARTAGKYGERADRYVRLEAGHAAQNLLLQAVALDLGAVPIGAFYDEQVQAALGLPIEQEPLYLIPVGR